MDVRGAYINSPDVEVKDFRASRRWTERLRSFRRKARDGKRRFAVTLPDMEKSSSMLRDRVEMGAPLRAAPARASVSKAKKQPLI